MKLNCGGHVLDLTRPQVMGVLNVTPDSFSDGGRYAGLSAAVRRGRRMAAEGAAIIDVGGESTRPGAAFVPVEEECRRVVPVIEALVGELDIPVSVDTSKPEVMREAVRAGAGMINDVRALRRPGALQAAAEAGVPVCLMHMQGEPETMQQAPRYRDVVAEVEAFLLERARVAESDGVPREALLLDPGFGFGKTIEHNLALFRGLDRLASHGYPLLVGLSRKSLLAHLVGAGRAPRSRLGASVAAAVLAVRAGASIVRVHDVQQTADALKVSAALAPVV